MRWKRSPWRPWRLPRRSLLAALFFFSLSSSFLYFVYVAPGIGKGRAARLGKSGSVVSGLAREGRRGREGDALPRPALLVRRNGGRENVGQPRAGGLLRGDGGGDFGARAPSAGEGGGEKSLTVAQERGGY